MRKIPRTVRFVLFIVTSVGLLTLVAFGAWHLIFGARDNVSEGQITLVKPDQTVRAFGDNYIASDGNRLYFYNKKNELKWEFGPDALEKSFDCSKNLVIVWWGPNMVILNETGEKKYNTTLKGDISFGRSGVRHAAVYVPSIEKQLIIYSTETGMVRDDIALGDKILLDFGFYSDQDSVWALLLDTSGSKPVTTLSMYKPGISESGCSFDEIVYKIVPGTDTLNAIGSQDVSVVTSAAELEKTSALVYGWQYIDSYVGKDSSSLLFTLSGDAVAGTPSRVKLITMGSTPDSKELHLPSGCISALVMNRSVYGIAPNAIYQLSADGSSSRKYILPESVSGITKVMAKLSNNRILVQTGLETRVLTLPG